MPTKTLHPQSRRNFLRLGASIAPALIIGPVAGWSRTDPIHFNSDPFTLGVASGDPTSDSVVLWTRLAPDPLNGGGMPSREVQVKWEIASDDKMQRVVARGTALARSENAHAVHVDAAGLRPARDYFYRFTLDEATSPIGRTRTAPMPGARNDRMEIAFASCQHFESGYYTAYQHMAQEDLDLVIHLGDYIYEGPPNNDRVRRHNSPEIKTLDDYRNRYALYKGDQLLKDAHARFPWAVVWDDHEVDNNYAGLIPEDAAPIEEFRKRRSAAYKAYYEHMPLRRSTLLSRGGLRIYRTLNFGGLANIYMLDTRQYRTDQPCGDGSKPACPESLSPFGTIMGSEQAKWLTTNLRHSPARWNVIAQQVMVAPLDNQAGPDSRFPMDQWNGYSAERKRLMEFMRDAKPSNPIVLTGDIHSNWVNDLKPEFYKEDSPVVATEFVGTSISTGGDGSDTRPTTETQLAENPHIKFYNGQRGYVRCSLKPDRWQSDYKVLATVTQPGASVINKASFVVENGKPGAKRI